MNQIALAFTDMLCDHQVFLKKQIHKLDLQWSILYLGDACLRLDERDIDRKARAMNICFKRHPHFQQVTLHWIQEGVIVTTDR